MKNGLIHQHALWSLFFACISILSALNAQSTFDADPRFDKAKPIAYLAIDHIGPRDPMEPGEGPTGLYLRFQNNSRIPMVVAVVKPVGKSASVPSLLDEVIPNRTVPLGGGVPWMPSPGFPSGLGLDDLQGYPNEDEEAVHAAEFNSQRHSGSPHSGKLEVRPRGYGWDLSPMLTLVPAGGTLLFSLPASHVSHDWHIEIPFRFGLEHDQKIRPPYSYLALYWEDLPKPYRTEMMSGPSGAVTRK